MSGTLFIVATPIGNLDDLSRRARQTLADVDLIAAEDTRRTRGLLSHFAIKTPLFALHEHNESRAAQSLLDKMAGGLSIALVSDAGTPLISDPGFRLVRAAHAAGFRVEPVPGVSALTAALSVSGLPTDRFCFEGFLPARPGARRTRIASLRTESRTMVFYESVHRLVGCVEDLVAGFGARRPAFIGRELTKLHEQCVAADLGGLLTMLEDGSIPRKGEFVIIVGGADAEPAAAVDIDTLLSELAASLSARETARIVALATGGKRNALYRRLLELQGGNGLE